jgi:hypothetical protein
LNLDLLELLFKFFHHSTSPEAFPPTNHLKPKTRKPKSHSHRKLICLFMASAHQHQAIWQFKTITPPELQNNRRNFRSIIFAHLPNSAFEEWLIKLS